MKKAKPETTNPKSAPRKAAAGCLMAAAVALPLAQTPVRADDAAPSRFDALVNLQIGNEYLTPRGMIVHDRGLDFEPLVLGFVNVYKGDKDAFINDVTLVPGVWNDFSSSGVSQHAPFNSKPTTSWVEIDPIAGVKTTFAKRFTLSETWTEFNMQILDIPSSQHLESKLAFDDTDFLQAFALHPYFLYWQELWNKATAADVPYLVNPLGLAGKGSGPGPSYYFDIGIDPSYTFTSTGIKIEAPCRVLLPDDRFYGTYYGPASTVGLYELGLKTTLPLNHFPAGYGHWSVHVGFKFMELVDQNLADMQQFNAPGRATDHTWQVYGGVSIFF
jgi:hypothetical protein